MALSENDKKYLNADQQKQMADLQKAYADAQAAGNRDAMTAAHNQAEELRSQYNYSGGADGSGYVPLSGQTAQAGSQQAGGMNTPQSGNSGQTVTGWDAGLSKELQSQIAALKEAYAQAQAAGDTAGMQSAHKQAEEIRNQNGYTGGASGNDYSFGIGALGGNTADKVAQWVEDYKKANQGYDANQGFNAYNNGYSVAMNQRSIANYIRQQMQANENAMTSADSSTRSYLHQQNQELAKLLADSVGGVESTYNEALGRWETGNANLGYGFNTGQYNDLDWYKNFYGMTDDQIKQYQNDTDRYSNFVDQRIVRNWVDESPGFTGEYAQFVNGPYSQLMGGPNAYTPRSTYVDVIEDGFGSDEYTPTYDENGNIAPQLPQLKNNNPISDYTRALAAYTQGGVIMPNSLNGGSSKVENAYNAVTGAGPIYTDSARELYEANIESNKNAAANDTTLPQNWGSAGLGSLFSSSSSGSAGSDLSAYLNQMYDAQLKSQLAALEAAYAENLSELDRNQDETNAAYNEEKRQAQGNAERSAANWRELANAQGLNTGAMGQAALAQNNQLQSNLNTLGSAQAQAIANIQSQRTLLGKQYQLEILQAQADNDYNRAQMLYQEAVRQDEILQAREQQYTEMMYDLLSSSLVSGGSSGSSGGSGSGTGGSSTGLEWLNEDNGTGSYTPSALAQNRVDSIEQYNSQYNPMTERTIKALLLNDQQLSDEDLEWAYKQFGFTSP